MLDAVLDQLRRSHAGDPWYGAPRMQFLAGLAPTQAAARPPGCPHSIWEIVLHMTAWTAEVRRRLAGRPPATPREGDWPEVPGTVTAAAWSEALAALEREHAALLADAGGLNPAALARPVGESREAALGPGTSVGAMLVGLAQHDAYHTGQLALLRRMLERGGAG